MKVLFIYFNKDYRPRTLLSLSIIETIVKNAGHQSMIFDTSFYPEALGDEAKNQVKAGIHKQVKNLIVPLKTTVLDDDFRKTFESFNPDLVAFSFYSTNTDLQHRLLIPLKKEYPHIPILAGGPQATINPDRSLREESYIDYVCCGEGEMLIQEVCNRIEAKQPLNGIKGLWYRDTNGRIIPAGAAPMTDLNLVPPQNLDSYDPIQQYGLFEGSAYRMGHVEFTRGCPYNCSYCGAGSIRRLYESEGEAKYVRSRDPELAVAEYKMLKEKHKLDMFYFIDGTFLAMPPKVLERLADLYKKEVNLPFIALVHPNTIKERTAELLKHMGCIHTSMGVESGIMEYRAEFLERKMTNAQIVKSIQLLTKKDIHVSAYNIIGMPGMDRKHVFETIKLNKEAGPSSSIVSIFIPYTDNDMTQKMIRDGLLDPTKIKVANGLYPTVEIKEMTSKEINGLFNTFNLYMKLPLWSYKLIEILEKHDNFITSMARKLIYRVMNWIDKKPRITPKRKITLDRYFDMGDPGGFTSERVK